MINNKAQKLLGVNNAEDFKVFSRKSITYNLIEDCGEYQVNEHYIQQVYQVEVLVLIIVLQII
ncbi:hypothetical protein TTHERM_00483420 (macronuclear) [Tetrahymena thermophila SB210]|uniref:Uncharacterized protein n=1 Tax=Tetrahymena thermophila (strain SB210) TaxID=312017 RepID=I7LV49_TETTS|nr:hypothetical protein TTHERM_00483420 [Tetrahymena thermophila SB210]EAR97210.2 hypothetical protein TTHERM_00483420 [Tetrahymena thermophila SB210]|eukprot:XP_001017455.2 hypothetical protein TTHERM_00483420 [Tetrahymena thermophila SB210]